MKLEIPSIKKSISSFLSGEEGSISKKTAVGLGVVVAAVGVQVAPVAAGCSCVCSCTAGGGSAGGTGGASGSCGCAGPGQGCSVTCGGFACWGGPSCASSSGGGGYTSVTDIQYSNGQLIGKHKLV